MRIEIRDLRHTYPTGEEALKGVSFTIEGVTPVAVVGQNGSGKTTLVKHFNRILSPTSGAVLIDGVETTKQSTAKWSKRVGYVFQNPDDQLFLNSVRKEFEFGPERVGVPAADIQKRLPEIAELCGLGDKLDSHTFDLTATQKKFCAIGSVMMMDPDVIIFDEPTCGQDVEGSRRLSEIIGHLEKRGKLCVTISHDMKFVAANFPRVVALCHGRVLIDGDSREVFAKPELLKKSFVSPPPISRVSLGMGFEKPAFSVDELVETMKARRRKMA
ncbi:MAG: energy-coupling factor ABC transporter ATP-binding protein [Clostridiales bacterium]|jgi:energy-coupling factor transport system ATP-binding protein|nr:energy-coupling factor ABC transporter ATP-binding protein [Clostridiales bacterium]